MEEGLPASLLEDLGDVPSLPLQLMQLTITQPAAAKALAQGIINQAKHEPSSTQLAIINLATTIIAYKFTHLTRQEVEEMLGFTKTELQKSRFYQEVKAEGREEGEQFLVLRQLSQQFGELSPGQGSQIQALSLDDLESLALAIFDFQTMADVQAWLEQHTH